MTHGSLVGTNVHLHTQHTKSLWLGFPVGTKEPPGEEAWSLALLVRMGNNVHMNSFSLFVVGLFQIKDQCSIRSLWARDRGEYPLVFLVEAPTLSAMGSY